MDLQSTSLKGIVRSSEYGLFYLFPIQSLSTLQEMKGHLTCAIDVLSNLEESDVKKTSGRNSDIEQPCGCIEC